MLKKKHFIFIAAGTALLAAAILIFAASANANTVKVAFYGLDERVQNAVKTQIDKMNLRRVRYYAFSAEEGLPKITIKNIRLR